MPILEGTSRSDRLIGSPLQDMYIGGAGADTFVINYLSVNPDVIHDFKPEEGDQVELNLKSTESRTFSKSKVSINLRGIVELKLLDGTRLPIVNIKRTDLKAKMDVKKGRYILTFKVQF